MCGADQNQQQFLHGRRDAGPVVAGEPLHLATFDPFSYPNIHVQHVVRATRGNEAGLGVVEYLVKGHYGPGRVYWSTGWRLTLVRRAPVGRSSTNCRLKHGRTVARTERTGVATLHVISEV